MKLALIVVLFSFLSLEAHATFYAQAQGGLVQTSSQDGAADYDGTSYGITLGKRLGFMALEVGYQQKDYGLKSAVGSLTQSDITDKTITAGLRLFFGRFIHLGAGASRTDTTIEIINYGAASTVEEKGRNGYYASAGLKIPVNKTSTDFLNYTKSYMEDIASVTGASDVKDNDSLSAGINLNF